jgi:hypothetical protein
MRGRGAAHLLLGERGEALGLRRALRGPLRHLAQCWQSHERIINLRRPFAAGQFDSYYGLERVVKQKFSRTNSPGEKTRRSKNSTVIYREKNFPSITPVPSSFRLRLNFYLYFNIMHFWGEVLICILILTIYIKMVTSINTNF